MQTSSDSLGAYLRAEREQRHVSLQEISAATKIQIKFLQALENDEYDQLPPSPFVVGFLRAYAQSLSLDAETIVSMYQRHYRVEEPLYDLSLRWPNQDRPIKRLSFAGLSAIVVGVLLLLVLHQFRANREAPHEDVANATLTKHTSRVNPPTVEPTNTPLLASETGQNVSPNLLATSQPPAALPAQPTEPQTVHDLSSNLPPVATATSPPSPPLHSAPPAEVTSPLLVLQVNAREKTWVRVKIDGDKGHALLLETGENIRWKAAERFILTIGNVKGTELLLNDRLIPLPPTRNNVVRNFLLTRDLLNE